MCFSKGGILWRFVIKICLIKRSTEVIRIQCQNFLQDPRKRHTIWLYAWSSTINQLTDLYNTFCQALDEGKEVRAICCDIIKAFGRVWYKGLLYKLSFVGISGSFLQWFSNYLNNRKAMCCATWDSLKLDFHKSKCSSRFDTSSSPFLNLYQWYCWKYPLFYKALCRRHKSIHSGWRSCRCW